MKHLALNPYLPLWEYVPDGEPRVFGGRLYIYGSHDAPGGEKGFCPGDYMAWSAPLDDLGNWTCHGVLYHRTDDPAMTPDDALFAPDVVQGPDGRYYLYYTCSKQQACMVAVSDRPQGPFTFLGPVQTADGAPYTEYVMFDPGVLVDDDSRVYLFTGFCMPGELSPRLKALGIRQQLTNLGFELAPDMRTIIQGPVPVLPGGNVTAGTGFEGHGFYEASSARKINGKYVLVYSSELSHELAYAVAGAPFGPYTYMGTLVSNADFGLEGHIAPCMPYGNTHGSLVELSGDWYVFHHRQTHGIECCRQGVAEKLPVRPDGWFGQAEMTSCGLSGGPLPARGSYNACYCCHLTAPQMDPARLNTKANRRATEPHIFEEDRDTHYIANILPGTVVGYKYFAFDDVSYVTLTLRGQGSAEIEVRLDAPDGEALGHVLATLDGTWQNSTIPLQKADGSHALYFTFKPQQSLQFESFAFA